MGIEKYRSNLKAKKRKILHRYYLLDLKQSRINDIKILIRKMHYSKATCDTKISAALDMTQTSKKR